MTNDPIIWAPERLPLSALLPKKWKRNPRQSSKRTAESLAVTKERFAQPYPILIDLNGDMVDGHQRIDAWAHKWGKDLVVDVSRANRPFSEEERQEFVLLFHQGAFGQWNLDELANNFDPAQLATFGFDTDALDQTRREMAFLIEMLGEGEGEAQAGEEGDAEPQVDKAAELQAEWGTEVGQLWHIGEHRLLIGDCTVRENVERLMGGEKADMMVTDPPYGIEYNPSWRADAGVNKNKDKMGKVENDHIADWTDAWRLFGGGIAYVYHAGVMSSTVQKSLENCDFKIRAQIIWAKDRMALSRGDYHWKHEPCWYAVRNGANGLRTDDRTQTTIWEIPAREDSGHGHGTQKPVECMARPIRNHEVRSIYDPFLGSGTTMVAAHNLGRKCYGMELSPAYGAVILQRMIAAFPDIDIYKAEG